MPRLGIVGTFVHDRIHPPPPARDIVDWGGMAYSLAAFEAARLDDWTFLPIANVGADLYEDVVVHVETLPGAAGLAGLRRVPEPNNRVELFYHDQGDRCERLEGGVPSIPLSHLEPLLADCDALYVNFIAGWELELDTARAVRRQFSGPIYVDVHSLLLGVDEDGMRIRRPLPEWPAWAECFDCIQGNEPEIRIVSGREDPEDGVATLVAEGAGAAFCTLGEAGAAWASTGSGPGVRVPVDPPLEAPVVDPTGCGDVWGATCVAGLVAGRTVPAAVPSLRGAGTFAG